MSLTSDNVLGALVPLGLPEDICVESLSQFIRDIGKYIGVQIPLNATNVVVGPQQPGPENLNALWVRQTNNGGFVGLYVYAGGKWRQIYPVKLSYIMLFDSDSRDYMPSEDNLTGYVLTWEIGGLSADQKNFLKGVSHYKNGDPAEGYWSIFPVTYVGF